MSHDEPTTPPTPLPLSVAHVCRPAVGERVCGDAFSIHEFESNWLVIVVDGLGHGVGANEASTRAIEHCGQILRNEPDISLERLMRSCHRALAGTRGAAVAFARLAPKAGALWFCGVGNIAMNCFPERRGLGISMPGVVGYRVRKIRVFESELRAGDLVAFYSDGISSRMSLKKIATLPLQELVVQVEADHGKSHDDATVVAVRVG